MQNILACIDASSYAASVCDLAAWASRKLELPVELLHVIQRKDAVAGRHDLSGAIGLGVKSQLLEELTQIEEADARLRISESRDSDSANCRTAVSLMSGQFGGDGPRLPCCRYG